MYTKHAYRAMSQQQLVPPQAVVADTVQQNQIRTDIPGSRKAILIIQTSCHNFCLLVVSSISCMSHKHLKCKPNLMPNNVV